MEPLGPEMSNKRPLAQGFRADYDKVFVKPWSPYVGALALVLVITALMLNGAVWGVFGGVRYWGDRINLALGLGPLLGLAAPAEGLLTHRLSLMNVTLVMGAFTAALMSMQFRPQRPPLLEYAWAVLGGCLMGIGAVLAGGCTTGGFFNPVMHSSPAGWVMAAGLLAGAALGLKLLFWAIEHISWGTRPPRDWLLSDAAKQRLPWLGLGVMALVIAWAVAWYRSGDTVQVQRAAIVLCGFAIGFVLHRARLCFARAFREPFVTGEGTMTKAVLLAVAVAVPLFALMFKKGVIDPYAAIPPNYWLGSLAGGFVFGIGMVFGGGCASGSLWRMGEGHLKLWVTLLCFAWSGSVAGAVFKRLGWTALDEDNVETIEKTGVGFQAYWPDMWGAWWPALLAAAVLLLLWYAWLRYNETTERFTLV